MKKYIFFVVFILSSLIILLIPKDIITKEYKIEYELLELKKHVYVYYVSDDRLIGVPIYTDESDKYKLISIVFQYLTEKSNSVEQEFNTFMNLNAKLLSYEIRNNDIYLEVNDSILNIKKENTLLGLSQLLYTYKELGYQEVYIVNNGVILEQMSNVILYNGLNELPVNLISNTSSINSKTIKITYYYKDNKKSFMNYIVNFKDDEVEFTLNKLVEFVNKEYQSNIKLISFAKDNKDMNIKLSGSDKELKLIKSLVAKNLNIKEENIIIDIE